MGDAAAAPNSALTEDLKATIQSGYRAWLQSRGFRPRRGQRQMIAEIARALAGKAGPADTSGQSGKADEAPRIGVVEAGTGTGKTVAYCLAAIPIARALDKRLVIATATVALQEQVAYRDLPDLQERTGLEFTSILAKGRGRYLCPKRLDERIAYDDSHAAPLFEPPDAAEVPVYQRFRSAFHNGSWNGDLDEWPDGVARATWTPVTNDRAGCSAGRCVYYHQCPFFRARQQVADADVVVANQDLLLADLSLGGGIVLPPPAKTLFVIDEAHHLADKTRAHFTLTARLRVCLEWLEQMRASVDAMAEHFERPTELVHAGERLGREADTIRLQLDDAQTVLRQLPFTHRDERTAIHRFPMGDVPEAVADLAKPLGAAFASIAAILQKLLDALDEVLSGDRDWSNAEDADTWLATISPLAGRAAAAEALFADYGNAAARQAARWATRRIADASDDIELASAPLDPGSILDANLWQACYGAVATSATLCAVGSFDRFLETVGLAADTPSARIASPFDFPRVASLHVPPMRAEPTDALAHTEELAALMPDLLAQERSALALFTSRRQFNAVVTALPDAVREHCQVQDTKSKQRLLEEHRRLVDAGEPSYLLGLASFAEGLDLPGDYCRHVIIAKIPFAVPDDPVDEALAEWLESQGRHPFFEIMVPDASLRLVQACGRLIRSDADEGRISLLDRRIVTKSYGRALLDSLPPYRLDIG